MQVVTGWKSAILTVNTSATRFPKTTATAFRRWRTNWWPPCKLTAHGLSTRNCWSLGITETWTRTKEKLSSAARSPFTPSMDLRSWQWADAWKIFHPAVWTEEIRTFIFSEVYSVSIGRNELRYFLFPSLLILCYLNVYLFALSINNFFFMLLDTPVLYMNTDKCLVLIRV